MSPDPHWFEYAKYRMQIAGIDPQYVLIHVAKFYNREVINPLLDTYWTQRTPYNAHIPNNYLVGCVPVAIGQIMNYHKWPANYADWQTIATEDDEQADETAQLLAKIGGGVGMSYGSGSSYPKWWKPFYPSDLTHVKNFFSKNGYSVVKDKVQGTKYYDIFDELRQRRPLYMEGTHEAFSIFGISIPNLDAHAWVCDGLQIPTYWTVVYGIYSPMSGNPYMDIPYNPYIKIDSAKYEFNDWSFYLHMNWGWGEFNSTQVSRNGWYYNGHIGIDRKTDYTVLYRFISAKPK